MEHYYTKNSTTEKVTSTIDYYFHGEKLTFISSNAVFSKTKVDFGSNHLIECFLEKYSDASGELLDVGCGYGPIGITLAKYVPNIKVTMVDINERAVELANINVKAHKVDDRATALVSDGFENVTGTFDYILTNPPIRAGKKVVHSIYEEAYKHLNQDGRLLVVIQKKQGAPSSQEKIEQLFGNCNIISKKSGYYILEAVKKN